MTENTLFKNHYNLSVNLLDTIFSALRDNLQKKDTLTLQDVEDAFAKIRNYWPNLLPIYEATCRECLALNAKAYVPDTRRKDFVTRLIFSRIVNRIARRPVGNSGAAYPHLLAPGVQANVKSIFTGTEYTVYNQLARSIFVEAGTDKDDEIWPIINRSESLVVSTNRILIKLLGSFRNFNTRHWEFLRILQGSVDANLFKVDDNVFCEVFEALFMDFEPLLAKEEGRLRFDLYYGESTAEQLNIVLMTYQRYRQGVDPALLNRKSRTGGKR